MTTSTIILAIGYIDDEAQEKDIVASLNRKIKYVSDITTDALKPQTHATDWHLYIGTAGRLDADALIKYFMGIPLFNNDHMQIFIARNGPTNFESYWNGGGDAQTQFRGNANWRRGK